MPAGRRHLHNLRDGLKQHLNRSRRRSPNRRDIARLGAACRAAVSGPIVHEPTPLLEQITAPIGGLRLVADGVSERHFAELVGIAGALGGPIAETGAEAVNGALLLHAAQQHRHGHCGELAIPFARKQARRAQRLHRLQNGDGAR